jgi:hypothetical protein
MLEDLGRALYEDQTTITAVLGQDQHSVILVGDAEQALGISEAFYEESWKTDLLLQIRLLQAHLLSGAVTEDDLREGIK